MKNFNASNLHTNVEVINIDFINTIDMKVGITAGINIKWRDGRLEYFNPVMSHANVVPAGKIKDIWLPSQHLIIENAILGQIEYDNHQHVTLHPKKSCDCIKLDLSRENRVFNGFNGLLEVYQRMKVTYKCIFDVYKFPFDEQKCNLVFKLEQSRANKVNFVMDGLVMYQGSQTIDQFRIGVMSTSMNNTQGSTKFILTIPFYRVSTNQLVKTFLPTFLLCFLGYATLMVDIDYSSDRFIGSVTLMLVLTTWISIINADLPKTTYVKMIDGWFVWHVVISFLIIIYHIALDRLGKMSFRTNIIQVQEIEQEIGQHSNEMVHGKDIKNQVNRVILVIFFFLNFIFYALYWILSLY
jgi:hypothetical protein